MSKRKSRHQQHKEANRKKMMLYGGGIVIVVAILALIALNGGINPAPAVAQERLDLDPVYGNSAATVTIEEYAAYSCTACRSLHQSGLLQRVVDSYNGRVNLVFRDLPIITPAYDRRAAQAAQCVLDQGNDAFWQYHTALFEQFTFSGASNDELVSLANDLGLDSAALDSCIGARTHELTVRYDENRGRDLGFRATPTIVINGQRIFSPSEDNLRAAIEQALRS